MWQPEDADFVGLDLGFGGGELEGFECQSRRVILITDFLGFVFEGFVQVCNVLLQRLEFSLSRRGSRCCLS
jgi:hypothetical protein